MQAESNVSDLTRAFLAHDLRDRQFGHKEHVHVAFDLVTTRPFVDASATYAMGIQSMANSAGVPDKFNLTIRR